MARILAVPINHGAGVTSTCLGLVHALEQLRVSVGFVKPFAQARWAGEDESVELFRITTSQRPPTPISVSHLEEMLAVDRVAPLMEEVVDMADDFLRRHRITVVEGLAPGTEQVYSGRVNAELARTLDADVLLVASAARLDPERLAHQVGVARSQYVVGGADGGSFGGSCDRSRVIGVVVNHIPLDRDPEEYRTALRAHGLATVACVHTHPEFTRRRVGDVVRELGLQVVNAGDQSRRVHGVTITAQAAPGFLDTLQEGRLVVVPGDRHDVLMSAALAETKGIRLGAVLLTAGIAPDPDVLDLCRPALEAGLPVLLSPERTYETATRVMRLDPEIPSDDEERANVVKETMAQTFDTEWLARLPQRKRIHRSTPAAFRREVIVRAVRSGVRIALTDSTDPAVLASAIDLQARSVCRCVLVGQAAAIERAAAEGGVELPPGMEVVEPADGADPLEAGLALLAAGEVDGLVGGDETSIGELSQRAADAVGVRPDTEVVSSVHYLLLPDEVVAYADCSLNPHPSAAQLAAIALDVAQESQAVGIPARIAFIAPGASSPTAEQETRRMRDAAELTRSRRPDYEVEGPVAFSAASRRTEAIEGAGNGTIFVFPDGATAEATFNAAHRTSGVRAVGPILQGLQRPVNHLPMQRGLREINAIIAVTAVQAARTF